MALSTIRELIREFYTTQNSFVKLRGAGLLSDVFPNTFTPSVGHPEAIQAVIHEPLPRIRSFIQDFCFRAIDLNRVGFGPHLSLFEMSVSLWITEFNLDCCTQEINRTFTTLVDILGLNPQNILVTTYPGGVVMGTPIPADDWSKEVWCDLGVPPENIYLAPGDACILVPEAVREPAGRRSEVFYRHNKKSLPFEIATLEFLQYQMKSEKGTKSLDFLPDRAGLYATAYGLERLEMAVASFESIFDIDALRSILEKVIAQVSHPGYFSIQPYSFRIVADAFRAATAILSTGQPLDRSRRGQTVRNLIGRLRRACIELGVSPYNMVSKLLSPHEVQNISSITLLHELSEVAEHVTSK